MEDIYHFRTRLLLTFTEKDYSQSAKHEVMQMFGEIPSEQKETVAAEAIPLVELSNTEQEAIMQVKQIVNKNLQITEEEIK